MSRLHTEDGVRGVEMTRDEMLEAGRLAYDDNLQCFDR